MQPTPRHLKEARIPSNQHDGGKSDLDPTEWKPSENAPLSDDDHGPKPKLTGSKGRQEINRPALSDGNSNKEATQYLAKFHPSSNGNPRLSGPANKGSRTLPPLSRASTATASSTASSTSSLSGSPYSLLSPPPVSVATTSITAHSDNSGNSFEGLSLQEKNELKYEKRRVKVPARKSAASGSLKKLLGSQL
ncbi:uncharacterized protein KY384_003218 [Bacidia gigantensis]|uniref:uncharacterized protein n=1 Tax=Bacidia gigantensis TaxID=2732470 RepID=UPI001D037C0F|nr:uncharacterized protein KY384_003218 [Bacidia gigantensis]KAG8531588.1 hypothetical protein KY384_003218 [Bacidia gigantensis]